MPGSCFLSPGRQRGERRRARARHAVTCLPTKPLDAWTTPACRPDSADRFAHSPPRPSLLCSLFLARTKRVRRRRRASPWPQPLPRLVVAPRSSASTPSSSPPSHEVPDALQPRHHRRFPPRAPTTTAVDSLHAGRRRACRASLRPRSELLIRTTLFPLAFASSRP